MRVPLLVVLPPLCCGYLLAQIRPAPTAAAVAGGLIFAVFALVTARRERGRLWLATLACAIVLASWAYPTLRLNPVPTATATDLPPRVTTLRFQVDRVFREYDRFGNCSGLATVLEASRHSALRPGMRIHYQLPAGPGAQLGPARGSRVRARGVLEPVRMEVGSAKPDSFEGYLISEDVFFRLHRATLLSIEHGAGARLQAINRHLRTILRRGEPHGGGQGNAYVAMLLGRKAALSPEQKALYQSTGTMHLFAISGLHVGVIATVLAQLLCLARVPRILIPFVGLPLLLLYVQITGAAPSAQRAFMMATFFWLSHALARQRSALAAWTASALLVLLWMPDQLGNIGFQLSYAVVFSILLFGLPLARVLETRLLPFRWQPQPSLNRLQRWAQILHRKCSLVLAISIAAWLASAPLIACHFGILAPGGILLNTALVTLASLIIVCGMLSGLLGLVGLTAVSAFLNHAAWLMITVMEATLKTAAKIPGTHFTLDRFSPTIAYAALVLALAAAFAVQAFRLPRALLGLVPLIIGAGLALGPVPA